VRFDILEQAGNAFAAFVGDEGNAMATARELAAERMRRNHVTAGAPGGQNEVALDAHLAPQVTT